MSENKFIRKFLLGNIRDNPKIMEIELKIISDPSFALKLSIAEDELIEEFLDNELSRSEARLFLKNFLNSPQRCENFYFIDSLMKYARGDRRN